MSEEKERRMVYSVIDPGSVDFVYFLRLSWHIRVKVKLVVEALSPNIALDLFI